MPSDCLFCAILAGDIPSTQVAEDDRTLAFMDINPASDGHLLVIPKEHARDLLEIPADDLAACAATAQRIARVVVAPEADGGLGADGVNLLNCCGADAWQTVFHFHLHVIPRYAGSPDPDAPDARDRLRLPWVPTPGDADTITAVGARLRAGLGA